jgi:hypothetical protein
VVDHHQRRVGYGGEGHRRVEPERPEPPAGRLSGRPIAPCQVKRLTCSRDPPPANDLLRVDRWSDPFRESSRLSHQTSGLRAIVK